MPLSALGAPDPSTGWMARALGALYTCGGLLAVAWVSIPHEDRTGDGVVLATATAAVLLGAGLLVVRSGRWPRWVLHACIAGIQVVVSLAYVAVGSAGTDGRFFYAWATPYSAFFFGRRAMAVHAGWTAVCQVVSLALIGDPLAESARSFLMTTGTVVAVGMLVSLVADRMRDSQEKLRHAALHDHLTGLVNRRGISVALDRALDGARRGGTSVAVVLVDLDRFKLVNDTHGHHVGDRMLAEVAPRLVAAVRAGDTVGRMGGDEFAVVCPDVRGEADLVPLLARLHEAWQRPVRLETGELPISGSVGVVLCAGTETAESVLRDADVALYRAKDVQRGSVVVFDASLRRTVERETTLDRALRGALSRDELAVHYQPIVDIRTEEVVGAEALLRWTSAELGPVSPAEFVPLAEDRGLIADIGAWALEEVCRTVAAWRRDGHVAPGFRVTLNVSGRQLRPGFAEDVRAARERHGLPADVVSLEITESVLLDDAEHVSRCLDDLSAAGTALVLDDFGTGFSSLSYLHRFPLSVIKLDRSFVESVGESSRQRSLVEAIRTMADALGMTVVAEGVETPEVACALRTMGYTRAQGYLWSPAVPAAEFPRSGVPAPVTSAS
jgi:diguanylate cyclase (GGDEF)-like protein